jgi:hypothetical protein
MLALRRYETTTPTPIIKITTRRNMVIDLTRSAQSLQPILRFQT